ncbi:hypothetical protein BT96DRAFT_943646 [Gymnopus androsaceus JB14]|uniref:Uncharacterized protein n=1 Tax=Gymnopus androsaceus JB14 TaxID=1447944 RepID=A0A6A4H809_9AGAR|nr:hypothetical protein BT96DRAFT_943646 [Gymnopus androsaceus JB14]
MSQFPDKPLPYFLQDITYLISERMIFLNENTTFPLFRRREFLGWYEEYLHGGIPESHYSFTSKDARAGFNPHTGCHNWLLFLSIRGAGFELYSYDVQMGYFETFRCQDSRPRPFLLLVVGLVVLLGCLKVLPRQLQSPNLPPAFARSLRIAKIVSLPLTDARLLLFWFLWTVFLQGIFACAEYQSQSEDLEILRANWVTFFDKHSPRMWFIEESILTYPFIGGDEFPGLSSPIVTPSELISGGFVNYHKFSIDFELSVSGLDQESSFPRRPFILVTFVEDVGLSQVGIHRFLRQALVFSTQARTPFVDNMFIDFEAVEMMMMTGEEDDNGQEPEEEVDDHDIDVEEDPSPIDNEIEFVGEAVEQPVRIQLFHGPGAGWGQVSAARTSNAVGTPYPETKGVRMITECFAAPGGFQLNNERVRLHATSGQLGASAPFLLQASTLSSGLTRSGGGCLCMPPEATGALIEDGFVAKTDTERLSMLAFLLGWDKCFTLEDLEFEGLCRFLFLRSSRCRLPSPRVPPIPGLVRRPQYKGKGKAKAMEAASEEGSAPEEASTSLPSLSRSSSESNFRFTLEAPLLLLSLPAPRKTTNQWPSVEKQPSPLPRLLHAVLSPRTFLRQNSCCWSFRETDISAHQVLIVGSGSKQGSRKRKRPLAATLFVLYAKICI